MKILIVITALFALAICQQIGGETTHKACTFSAHGRDFVFDSTWKTFSPFNDANTQWYLNPCEIDVTTDEFTIKNKLSHAGAFFVKNAASYSVVDRGDAHDATWKYIFGADNANSYISVNMVNKDGVEANPRCSNQYLTSINYFCDKEASVAKVSILEESDCSVYFKIISKDACPINPIDDVDSTQPSFHTHSRSHMFLFPMMGLIACLSALCCCACARKRKQAKILSSNFSNVAFQPIPSNQMKPTSLRVPVQPAQTQSPFFAQPNHIQIPQTYFFAQPSAHHVVQLEEMQPVGNQVSADEEYARELQRQFDQNRY